MASQTFTPANVIDMTKERDWAANIGMMDWDSTRIVFTKRTLIEFLRYTGTTVDTNFSNVSKLPKFATFGKLGEGFASADVVAAQSDEEAAAPTAHTRTPAASNPVEPIPVDGFRPTRRVRTAPGGETHDIFGHYVDDDALASAPPRQGEAVAQAPEPSAVENTGDSTSEPEKLAFRPTRRVRETPGGRDNMSDILFGGAP
ncbi:hypothetical protein BC835DRAFT_1321590 [Cytidiella melzeri]|nr:hypothetical protein BC835DRAFT_1321590 [Cytidiella melzeri]